MRLPLAELRYVVDRTGRVLSADSPDDVLPRLGLALSDIVGKPIADLLPGPLLRTVSIALNAERSRLSDPDLRPSLATLRNVSRYELSVLTATGSDPVSTEVIFRLSEIDGQFEADDRSTLVQMRHRLWSENSDDVIWAMALDGSISYVSPAVKRMRGYTQAEAMQQSIDEILTPPYQNEILDYFAELQETLAAGGTPRNYRADQEYKCKDGSTIWTEVLAYPLLDSAGKFVELIGVTRDIADRKRYEFALAAARKATDDAKKALEASNAELKELTSTDAMTGARSRRYLELRAELQMTEADRQDSALSLIFLDLDNFKSINDQHGHHCGDQVIATLADSARRHLRADDLLARWGGDEFVVLLPQCALREAMAIADRIRLDVASRRHLLAGKVTASFGVAQWHRGDTREAWFNRADVAMYEAKASGRNAISSG